MSHIIKTKWEMSDALGGLFRARAVNIVAGDMEKRLR